MSGVTGIELGPNYCVLVRGGQHGAHRTVSAAATLMPPAWPADRDALVEQLREARTRNELPPRARVVLWGEGDGVGQSAVEATMLAPLVEAGFEIASVVSPVQALGRVVRARRVSAPPGTAVAALSLNRHGAVIAIVSGTQVIHSRVVEWPLGPPFSGERGRRSELLERYLVVSQIAPQLQHDIDLVRPVHGVTVTSVVACGNLPNLRSLAMLLIEELDVEVETLDSDELLDRDVAAGTLVDIMASLQLAAAVASSGLSRVTGDVEPAPTVEIHDVLAEPAPRRFWSSAQLQSLAALAVIALSTAWSVTQVAGSSPARPVFPGGLAPVFVAAVPLFPDPLPGLPELRAEATAGRVAAVETVAAQAAPRLETLAGVSDPTIVRPSRRLPGRVSQAGFPLPSVDGIMIAGSYRLAIVGGNVVAPGDPVGPRAIARIERDGVVLREPSGREVYVAIRPRRPPLLGS